jgi:hypothetical protein
LSTAAYARRVTIPSAGNNQSELHFPARR